MTDIGTTTEGLTETGGQAKGDIGGNTRMAAGRTGREATGSIIVGKAGDTSLTTTTGMEEGVEHMIGTKTGTGGSRTDLIGGTTGTVVTTCLLVT